MSIFKKLLNLFSGLFKRKKKVPEKPKEADLRVEEKKEKPVKKEPIKKKERKEYPFAHQVLIKPLVTEKASSQGEYNQYSFEVAKNANKIEIKKAILSVYSVEPLKVRTIKMGGKQIRYGRRRGRTKAWKKAMITLRQGDKIEVYEGV